MTSSAEYKITAIRVEMRPNPVGARMNTRGKSDQKIMMNHMSCEFIPSLGIPLKRVMRRAMYAIALKTKNHHRSMPVMNAARNPQNITSIVKMGIFASIKGCVCFIITATETVKRLQLAM